jgi:hypothetical protein
MTYMGFIGVSLSRLDAIRENRESPTQREEADTNAYEDDIHHGAHLSWERFRDGSVKK